MISASSDDAILESHCIHMRYVHSSSTKPTHHHKIPKNHHDHEMKKSIIQSAGFKLPFDATDVAALCC